MRKSWESLSPSYRSRLERSGISAESYSQGVSLKAARGHATTPERPERAFRHPDVYGQYLRRRVASGKPVPENMIPSPKPRIISDAIGWPGRESIDVWTFERSAGGSAGNELGVMKLTRRNPDGSTTLIDSRTYNQRDFVTLAKQARERGFVVTVVSVPSMGVTA